MKIKGVDKLPDFIQVRDDAFTLIGYYRADKPHLLRQAISSELDEQVFEQFIRSLPHGQLSKF